MASLVGPEGLIDRNSDHQESAVNYTEQDS